MVKHCLGTKPKTLMLNMMFYFTKFEQLTVFNDDPKTSASKAYTKMISKLILLTDNLLVNDINLLLYY